MTVHSAVTAERLFGAAFLAAYTAVGLGLAVWVAYRIALIVRSAAIRLRCWRLVRRPLTAQDHALLAEANIDPASMGRRS